MNLRLGSNVANVLKVIKDSFASFAFQDIIMKTMEDLLPDVFLVAAMVMLTFVMLNQANVNVNITLMDIIVNYVHVDIMEMPWMELQKIALFVHVLMEEHVLKSLAT